MPSGTTDTFARSRRVAPDELVDQRRAVKDESGYPRKEQATREGFSPEIFAGVRLRIMDAEDDRDALVPMAGANCKREPR